MDAPSWIVKQIELINPQARLGWAGRERCPDNPKKKGAFALIELRAMRNVDKDRSIIGVRWEHGKIFGTKFDRLMRVPMFIITVSEADVSSGKVLTNLRRWCKPFKERALAMQQERGEEYEREVTELATEQADYMLHKAKSPGSSGVVATPKKHLTPYEKSVLDGSYMEDPRNDLTKAFTEAPAGGVALP